MSLVTQRLAIALSALSISSLLLACPSASTTRVDPRALDNGGARAPAAAITVPEDGFWERFGDGSWRYDLAVEFVGEVQLMAPGQGRGLVRVTLPPGASAAELAAITVKYVRGAVELGEEPAAAGGKARWHVHADAQGRPGARLGGVEADIDGARAVPLDYEWDESDEGRLDLQGTRHALSAPLVVPSTFWLVFERVSGNPRVGGMWLTAGNGLIGTYENLYFVDSPDAPVGQPKNIRPLLAVDFKSIR